MRILILASLILWLASCVSKPALAPNGVEPLPPDEYQALISKNTRATNQYAGFYQTFQAEVTLLTTEVQTATLKQRASFLQWDQAQYQTEREKALQEASAYSKAFIRFFAPERDYDDLSKGAKSIWKVYLEYGGNRFEGKVRKMTEKMVELQSLFPHYDRFSTPYEVSFNVPMTTVESGPCKIVMTSSLGTAEFSFPAGK